MGNYQDLLSRWVTLPPFPWAASCLWSPVCVQCGPKQRYMCGPHAHVCMDQRKRLLQAKSVTAVLLSLTHDAITTSSHFLRGIYNSSLVFNWSNWWFFPCVLLERIKRKWRAHLNVALKFCYFFSFFFCFVLVHKLSSDMSLVFCLKLIALKKTWRQFSRQSLEAVPSHTSVSPDPYDKRRFLIL